ncbi:polysaccharide biosynthesis tyrosine autokinase [uncultured Winogradskyella sp.]|uniref:GumC family protein n=1 Tax=uncultured Winogradskyella sp. TaxID=395353 RepID=UPI002626CF48|nr:polysaccharide biosynthesis tyrosine autokinase [uncultured Winogradskyella sp.]
MDSQSTSITSLHLRNKLELFSSYWKIILLSLIVTSALAFVYLRYATYEYSASAKIKIQDENQSKKIQGIEGVSSGGLFTDGTDKIKDEIEIMTSRTLVENVVKTLKLNIRCFEQGSIIENELYENPPVMLSFFASDSVINKVDTTLFMKIKSPSEFLLFSEGIESFKSRDDKDGKLYSFGEKINTSFGGLVITPNIGKYAPKIGSNLKLTISSVRKIVNGYKSSIAVSTGAGSSIVTIELKQSNAAKAVDILNELIKEYNKDVLLDKEAVIQVTSEFIDNRLNVVSQELEEVDFTAEQLQKNNKLTALASQADINLQSERNSEAQIMQTSNQLQLIDFLQDEVSDENRASDLLPQNVINDQNVSQVTKNYNDLVVQRDKMLKNSTEKNPIVIKLNDEINALKGNLQNTLKNMKESNQITLNTLKKEDARIRGQIYSAPTRQRQFRNIERQQGIKESLYLYLLEKREETSIRLGMYSPSAKIIDSAYSSNMPVSPNKMFTYLAAILMGMAIPMGFIYVKDLLDTKLYSKDDLIDTVKAPYIGDVPRTSKKAVLIKKIDYSPKAEAFRIIRSNIDFILKGNRNNAKKIFITSTKAQEGKSHTSTNLASSISFSEKSVLLIEMDIRVPKILNYLGLGNDKKIGVSDFIVDKKLKPQDIIIKQKDNKFLDIIPSGTIPPNPSELLMSDRIGELFKYFDDKYDYIIVDTSAVGLVSDTLLIADYADMFVYVVSADNVDKRQLGNVANTLYEKKRLPKMTMLLNGVKKGTGGYGYGYGYGNNPNRKKKWYSFSKS